MLIRLYLTENPGEAQLAYAVRADPAEDPINIKKCCEERLLCITII